VLDAERELLVRIARPADRGDLERLATLDSQPRLEGDALLAELDGIVVAALSLRDERLVADPFEQTAAVGDHLRLRASSIRSPKRPAAPLKRLLRSIRRTWNELNYLQRRLVEIQMDADSATRGSTGPADRRARGRVRDAGRGPLARSSR
jgi:hypothetical protein